MNKKTSCLFVMSFIISMVLRAVVRATSCCQAFYALECVSSSFVLLSQHVDILSSTRVLEQQSLPIYTKII